MSTSKSSFKESGDRANYYIPSFKELCARFNYEPVGTPTVGNDHAAKMIGWKPNTLEIKRSQTTPTNRKSPSYIKVGGSVRYAEYDVLLWLAQQTVGEGIGA